MSFFIFLTVVQALVGAMLVGVILMQRSEGGGLGVGGSPGGLMSARGAADFLTRMTTILASLFVVLSIILAALAVGASSGRKIDTTLNRTVPGAATGAPLSTDPLAGINTPAPGTAPAPAASASAAPAGSAPTAPLNNPLAAQPKK